MRTIIVLIVMPKSSASRSVPLPAGEAIATAPKRVSSDALLGPGRELVIVHGNREYRLRITQNGKLILTA
jgi:hemin uptake protein HemP